jgi:hypothetical protein
MSNAEFVEHIKRFRQAIPSGIRMTITGVTAEAARGAVEAESTATLPNGRIPNEFYHFLFEIEDGAPRCVVLRPIPHLLGEGDGLGPLRGLGRAQTAEMRACPVELGQGPGGAAASLDPTGPGGDQGEQPVGLGSPAVRFYCVAHDGHRLII